MASDERDPFRFLDLPFDIREHVYKRILTAREAHPVIDKDHTLNLRDQLTPPRLVYKSSCFITRTLPPTSVTHLLVTNRQIHFELTCIIETMSRNPALGITYTLDLTATGNILYPTWISLPTPPRYMTRAHVLFRLEPPRPLAQRWWDNQKPSALTRGLIQLLANFLVFGPSFRQSGSAEFVSRRSIQPCIRLHELTIEFVRSNPDAQPIQLEYLRRDPLLRFTEERDCLELIDLLDRVAESGQLNGRVDRLQFVVGDQRKEWNIAGTQVSKGVVRKTAKKWAAFGWKAMADALDSGF